MARLNDNTFRALDVDGYAIIDNYLPAGQCADMAAAIRRILPAWDSVCDDPPVNRLATKTFPYAEPILNSAIVDREAIAFSKRWLGTEAIHYRPGIAMATYPGFKAGDGEPHIDNGNNSLLPASSGGRAYGQIIFWFYLEDVVEDQGPTLVMANADGGDLSKAVPFVGRAGSVLIFRNDTWHAASDYVRESGQRYVWKFAFGRADHYWEGVLHYTHVGNDPHFQTLISGLAAADRELFRFPPAGHAYYTDETLAKLEAQYPGWNARGAY